MALKAGYLGVKKNLIDLINTMAGGKIIKTIGNGLTLSDAGALSADIDTDTMEFKEGKLSAKSTGGAVDYSITPVPTGSKWIDGKDVKMIVITKSTDVQAENTFDLSSLNINEVISIKGTVKRITSTENFDYFLMSYEGGSMDAWCRYNYENDVLTVRCGTNNTKGPLKAILEYTEKESE